MASRAQCLILGLAGLLALQLAGCLPPTEEEKERAEAARRAAAPRTPTPTPKPGAWMYEKRANPLGIGDKALKATPKK